MAHWAEIDQNNQVIRVLVGNNDHQDEGYQWLIDNLGGTWIKTSYNTREGIHISGGIPLRKNYAGIGYIYDVERDAFIPPKPNPIISANGIVYDWQLDEYKCVWVSDMPVADAIDENESPYA